MSKSLTAVPAARVRTWFAGLTEDEQATIPAPGSRGRLNPVVVEAFAKANPGEAYVLKTPKHVVTVSYKHTQPSGRKVTKTATMSDTEARALAGEAAGKRGPLSKAALAAAGEALAKQ